MGFASHEHEMPTLSTFSENLPSLTIDCLHSMYGAIPPEFPFKGGS